MKMNFLRRRPGYFLVAVLINAQASMARGTDLPKSELLHRTADVTVLLADEDQALDRLISEATRAGGYFAERGPHHLKAKIPTLAADEYLQIIKGLGTVVENRYATEDLTETHARLLSQVESRRAMLARYLAAMAGTKNRDDLRTIETATKDLLTEVEHGEGALRVIDQKTRFATIDVSFKLRDRTPVRIVHENHFAWLGTVDLSGLLADFASASEAK